MLKLKEILRNRQFNRSNETKVTITCPDCGNNWEMTLGELSWYHEVGNIIPIACENCRKVKKTKRITNDNAINDNVLNNSIVNSNDDSI